MEGGGRREFLQVQCSAVSQACLSSSSFYLRGSQGKCKCWDSCRPVNATAAGLSGRDEVERSSVSQCNVLGIGGV